MKNCTNILRIIFIVSLILVFQTSCRDKNKTDRDNIILAKGDKKNDPKGNPDKPGPHGWPTDQNGVEVIPSFTHASHFFIQCWTPEPNNTLGVIGKISDRWFKWDCDRLADYIANLNTAIENVWGENSVQNFNEGNHRGHPALSPPTYPKGFYESRHEFNFIIEYIEYRKIGRVVIKMGNLEMYFDEKGANYMLRWLSEMFSACCL